MPVGGVGGLFGQLFNPGLDQRLAQHITPNPSPLAQQGGPAVPGSVDSLGNASPSGPPPGSNLAPAAVTAPDPVNASYAADMLAASRRDANAAMMNSGLDQMAASFGTAQQQQSKQAQLRGGGGAGDSLGDLAKIQAMQDTTIADNEHARYMANVTVLAQRMGVSPQEIIEMSNTKEGRDQISNVIGGNLTKPDKLKEADAEARAWGDAHPDATPQEIAQHKSDFLAQTAGGLSTVGKQLAEDRRNWHNDPANKGKTDAEMIAEHPELADEVTYVAIKGEQAKTTAAAGQARLQAKESFKSVDPTWQKIEENIDVLNKPENRKYVLEALRSPDWVTTGQWGRLANAVGWTSGGALDVKNALDQLRNEGFTKEFKDTKNIRSNTEANRIGAAFSGLFSSTISDDKVNSELDRLSNMVHDGRANIAAAAGQRISSKYSEANIDPDYLDSKSPLYNGATREYLVPTQANIDKLKADPSLAEHFDKLFGPGAAKRALGQ